MDCDQENMSDDDRVEGSDHCEKSLEEIFEKMKKSPSELSEVGDNKPNNDGEGTGQRAVPAPTIRKCEFCGKEFNSGKALGGHKRIHLQAHRKLEKANINTNNKANCTRNNKLSFNLMPNGKLKISCYVCNREFPSKKSLFGHMRSHTDRNWRGVHPPTIPGSDNHSSCSSNSEPGFDVSRYLSKSWKKTSKRGRECVFDAEMVAAAETLVAAFSRYRRSRAEFPELPRDHENLGSEEEDHDIWSDEEEYCMKKNMKGLWNGVNNTHEASSSRLQLQDHASDHFDDIREVMMIKKKNKKRKKLVLKLGSEEETLLTRTLKPQDVLQCAAISTCEKSFSSFEALGGHKSGHSKEKNNNSSMDEERAPNDAGEANQSSPKFDLNEPPYMQDEENNQA